VVRWRRLVGDYQRRINVFVAMIHLALGSLAIKRIAL